MHRLPGASNSFAKQLASPDGREIRTLLQGAVDSVPPPLAERWREVLTSLDNRRFFQGFAEAVTAWELTRSGWNLLDLGWPGPWLVADDPQGRRFQVLVLAFIRQVRLLPDRRMIDRLTRSLNRVGSKSRIAVLVRRWLPHDFDPEPVRRAIDLWLGEVDRMGWDGRYAAYDDDNVSLEFALTGDKASGGQAVVAFTLGPFDAQRTLEAFESRTVFELDAHRLRNPDKDAPLIVSSLANQPWGISRGYMRELLFGKPVRQVVDEPDRVLELTYGPDLAPSLFRDPVYRNVSAVMMLERDALPSAEVHTRVYRNPWSTNPLGDDAFRAATMGLHRWESDRAIVRWRK